MDVRMVIPDLRVKPPFSPPDCPFKVVSCASTIPENAKEFGTLDGNPVYLGRVYEDECWYVGTAVPSKELCYYINGKFQLKSSDVYEILTVDCGDPLEFQAGALKSHLLFVAGGNPDRSLYAARFVDGENTYIGWVTKSGKVAYIPRGLSLGSNKIDDPNYDVLIHKYLDRLAICPSGSRVFGATGPFGTN